MPTLPELQTRLAAAILREDAARSPARSSPTGCSPAARVQIYWNHVFTSLTEALEADLSRRVPARGPPVLRLRGGPLHPAPSPGGPVSLRVRRDVPRLPRWLSAVRRAPVPGDVARLEWAMNAALHAEEVAAIEPAALASVAPSTTSDSSSSGSTRRRPGSSPDGPSTGSGGTNQPEASPESTVDLAAGPARLEIRRRGDVVTLRRLEPAELRFRAALRSGATLETATDAAGREDARFDLTPALRALLAEELVSSFALEAVTDGSPP